MHIFRENKQKIKERKINESGSFREGCANWISEAVAEGSFAPENKQK
jgi:hypothetical protein